MGLIRGLQLKSLAPSEKPAGDRSRSARSLDHAPCAESSPTMGKPAETDQLKTRPGEKQRHDPARPALQRPEPAQAPDQQSDPDQHKRPPPLPAARTGNGSIGRHRRAQWRRTNRMPAVQTDTCQRVLDEVLCCCSGPLSGLSRRPGLVSNGCSIGIGRTQHQRQPRADNSGGATAGRSIRGSAEMPP